MCFLSVLWHKYSRGNALYTIGPRLLCLLVVLAATNLAAAQTSFTISGTIKDATGAAIPDAMLVLLSDVNGTQIAFTDQSGNYVFTHPNGVSHSLRLNASKSGYIFDPLGLIFISTSGLSGDKTVNFIGTQIPIVVVVPSPVLLTQENSLRSLALDSVTQVAEPFGVTNIHNFSTDQRTRLSLFAVLELGVNGTISDITAQAENSVGTVFPLPVEFLGAVPNFPWLKQVVVKLPDEIANSVDVRVSLSVRGLASNKVLVKVKP